MMERGIFALLRAINSAKAPCEDCLHYIRCYKGYVACETFRGYVNGTAETGLNPTKKIYKDVFYGGTGIA